MIIKSQHRHIDAVQFQQWLPSLLGGLVKFTSSNELGSGWVITPNLVIVPDYFITKSDDITCISIHAENQVAIKASANLIQKESSGKTPAVLVLEKPWPFPPLSPELGNTEADMPIMVLHYPGGTNQKRISFGTIESTTEDSIIHDADTEPGSGGGPLVNLHTGKICGMHVGKSFKKNLNTALSISRMLEVLKETVYWDEIIKYHKIADTRNIEQALFSGSEPEQADTATAITENTKGVSAKPAHADIIKRAAISWDINSGKLSAEDKQLLAPLVPDPDPDNWVLRTSERQTILQQYALDELAQLEQLPGNNSTGNKVIRTILGQQSIQLEQLPEEELPYWLQAARWFTGTGSHVPDIAAINRVLEKKKVRSRFRVLAGEGFTGRDDKETMLSDWYRQNGNGPIIISGIGGIGKSALISHFALSLPEETPIAWLDFDRVDLKSDDPKSVLKILSEQLTIQVPGFKATNLAGEWKENAIALGEQLNASAKAQQPPLIVLDGFEVAQSIKGYSKIWELFDLLLSRCDYLKLIVSGRAKVNDLMLNNRPGVPLPLSGISKEAETKWIENIGINEPEDIRLTQSIAKGIPLVLRMIEHYLESGNSIEDLRNNADNLLIEGYLYRRILDRIMDEKLKPVARRALLLRKISIPVLEALFSDFITAENSAADLFQRLSNELSLVEDTGAGNISLVAVNQQGMLMLRPEVRMATLKLLEEEAAALPAEKDRNWILAFDKQAADFYSKAGDSVEMQAERVYHLLRSRQLAEAKRAWKPEMALHLAAANEDLAEDSPEQQWLEQQLRAAVNEEKDDIRVWESQTFSNITSLLTRGHYGEVKELLRQRSERSKDSVLHIYDAWSLADDKRLPDAKALLESFILDNIDNSDLATPAAILLALYCAQLGFAGLADGLLSETNSKYWKKRKNGQLEELALRAARIRLTVFPDYELSALQNYEKYQQQFNPRSVKMWNYHTFLPRMNLLTHSADRLLESLSSELNLAIPVYYSDLTVFREKLESGRTDWHLNPSLTNLNEILEKSVPAYLAQYHSLKKEDEQAAVKQLLTIILAAEFRWKQATQSMLLADMARTAVGRRGEMDPLNLSIAATLCAFRGEQMGVMMDEFKERTIDSFLQRVVHNNPESAIPPLSDNRKAQLLDFISMDLESYGEKDNPSFHEGLGRELEKQASDRRTSSYLGTLLSLKQASNTALFLYLYGPDPLEMLCRQLLGLPNNYKF